MTLKKPRFTLIFWCLAGLLWHPAIQGQGIMNQVIQEYQRRHGQVSTDPSDALPAPPTQDDLIAPSSRSEKLYQKAVSRSHDGPSYGEMNSKLERAIPWSDQADYFRVFMEPIKFVKVGNQRFWTVGHDLNTALGKSGYRFSSQYEHQLEDRNDTFSQKVITYRSHEGMFTFEKPRFWGNFDLFLMGEYQRVQTGVIFPIYRRILGGIVGLKYNFLRMRGIPEVSLSYIPLYESLHSDAYIGDTQLIQRKVREQIRQSFLLNIRLHPMKNLVIVDRFRWKPVWDLKENKFNSTNAEIKQDFKVELLVSEAITLSYVNTVTWSKRLKVDLRQPSTNLINSFRFNYKFDL